MNLNGWDTTSIASIDLINHALEQNTDKLVTKFSYKDAPIQMSGVFGPWKIVEGGSPRNLHVEIPIREGSIRGVVRRKRTDLTGVVMRVEIGLRLLPRAKADDTLDLMFDLEGATTPDHRPIKGLDVRGVPGQLSSPQLTALRLALVDCLNAHAAQVAFVFATVKSRGTAQADWLRMPYNDFAYVPTVRGPGYLALLGASAKPTAAMTPDRLDIALLDGAAPAFFALSHRLYLRDFVLPWLNGNFRPRGKFAYSKVRYKEGAATTEGVALVKPVMLPKSGTYTPRLKVLTFSIRGNALCVLVEAEVHVAMGCHLQVRMTMKMPMALDTKTGKVSIALDPKPTEEHWFDSNNPLGWIVAAVGTILEWLIPALRAQISGAVTGIAKQMQGKNNPLQQPTAWNGLRDFKPARFKVSPCIWFADTRPVEPLTFRVPVAEHETLD